MTAQAIAALVAKDDFFHASDVAHLCAGGETPILHGHLAAVERFFAAKSRGMAGRSDELMGLLDRCRSRAGDLLDVPPADIAFLGSATEGINQLANGLDWQPGDNVVVEDIEFPSDIYPWTRLEARGVEVRVAPQWGENVSLDRLAAVVDRRTRLLAVSQVSYLTGRRYDLADLAEIARSSGALLSVDATHAAGVLPVAARQADLLVSSCYKFLLGVHGAAICYVNPERLADLRPQQVGWNSAIVETGPANPTRFQLAADATRFEAANPPFMALAVLDNALAYLSGIGIERIKDHVLALGDLLWDALDARGFSLLTPRDRARRGPNICFAWSDPSQLVAQLAERGVLVWGDAGRVRVSFHAYNDEQDVMRLLAALDNIADSRQLERVGGG
jgi:selenocysteine lyase/cysteine desulfurase